MTETAAPLSAARAACFGAGSLGTVIFVIVPQLLLLYFLTTVLGVPPAWAGIGILLPKAAEMLLDPAIGALSDGWRGRLGRRLPFMLAGGLLFPAGLAAVFAPPVFAAWQVSLAWTILVYVLATAAYTTFSVPYITLVGEAAGTEAARVRLTAWRMGFVSVGVLIAGGLAPALVARLGGGRAGYAGTGLALGACCAVAVALALTASWALPRPVPGTAALGGLWRLPRLLLGAPPYLRLWSSYVVQMTGTSVNAAILPFAVEHLLRTGADTVGLIFGVMTLCTLAGLPAAVVLARRLGGPLALIVFQGLAALGTALFGLASAGNLLPAYAAAAIYGLGQAGTSALPFALMPGAAAAAPGAAASAGAFAGVWIAGEKLGLALGAALAGVALQAAGFGPGHAGSLSQLALLWAALPAVLLLAAIGPLLGLAARGNAGGR